MIIEPPVRFIEGLQRCLEFRGLKRFSEGVSRGF